MFPLNSNDQYIDTNGKRHSLSELFEGSEHDIEELEETVTGHTTQIGALQEQINPDEYSETDSYTAGDYVIHDNVLYKCNTSCTADTWANNSQYFTEKNVADELTSLNSNLKDYVIARDVSESKDLTTGINRVSLTIPTVQGYVPFLFIYAGNGANPSIINYYNIAIALNSNAASVDDVIVFNGTSDSITTSIRGVIIYKRNL